MKSSLLSDFGAWLVITAMKPTMYIYAAYSKLPMQHMHKYLKKVRGGVSLSRGQFCMPNTCSHNYYNYIDTACMHFLKGNK